MLKPATFYSIINLKADENHEADKNAENGAVLRSRLRNKYKKIIQDFKTEVLEKGIKEIKLEISLASASLEDNINLFKVLLSDQNILETTAQRSLELNFASLYDHFTYLQLNLFIKNLLKEITAAKSANSRQRIATPQASELIPKIKAYTPLTTNYIKQILENNLNSSFIEIIPAIFCKADFLELKTLIGEPRAGINQHNISSIKIFPCLIQNTQDLINSFKNPVKELQELRLNYSDSEGLEINNSQDLENLVELASRFDNVADKKTKIGVPQRCLAIKIKNSYYPNRFTEIIEMILLIWDINPEIHITCAGFNGASLEEIGSFYDKLINILEISLKDNTLKTKKHSVPKLTDKISIATRNNNFYDIQKFFKYSSI